MITGPDGNALTYTYDAIGNLVGVTDTGGSTVQFTYLNNPDHPHYLDTVIDPLGRPAAKTEYDEQGRIKRTIDADGKTIEYDFSAESKIQRVTDQLGNVTIIENDAAGNVIRQQTAGGAITLYTYDANGNTLSETQVVLHNGEEIRLTTRYTYDANNNKLSETDARGNVTRYTYNQYDQIVSTTSDGVSNRTVYAENGLPTYSIDANGNRTTYGFDTKGNLTGLTNANGVTILTSTYNKYGEVTSVVSNGRITYFDYDLNGDCIATWYYDNGVMSISKTLYDDKRQVIGQEQWLGETLLWSTQTVYNAAEQVIEETDRYGLKTEHTYDNRGLETQSRWQVKDTDGNIIWYAQRTVYDAAGNSIYSSDTYREGTTEPISGSATIYDADGNVIESKSLLGLEIAIDEYGRSTIISEGTVLSSNSTVYNNAGWILSSTDSYGLETHYTYNVYGETTQTRRQAIDENGQTVWFVTQTVYDLQGRTVFSVDSHLENSTAPCWGTQYIYDAQGRTTATIRYKGAEIAIDTAGETTVTSFGTEVYRTETVYNAKGQVYQSIDANGNTTTYEYDNLDRQIAATDSNGLRNETVYNNLGQVVESKIIANGQTKSTTYVYDRFGNVVQTTYPDGTSVSAQYNNEGQKIAETNQIGQTRTFEYSDNGQLTAVVLPGNLRYEYAYDAQGNQTLIRDPLGHETRFTYDENGNQLTRTLPLGFGIDGIFGTEDDNFAINPDGSLDFTERFEYNSLGRTVKSVSLEGGVTTYSYDAYGRLSAQTYFENQAAYEANQPTEVWSYEYDAYGRTIVVSQNGRLTNTTYTSEGYVASITTPEGTVSYTYDDFGRQLSVSDGTDTTSYTYDSIGRLATVTSQAGATTYSYDVFGNLSKVVTSTGSGIITSVYEYDVMNRLTRLTNFADANDNGVMDDGEGVSRFDYTLNSLGNKTHATETFWFDNNEDGVKDTNVNSIDWTYDAQNRLIQEVFDHYDDNFDQTLGWTYDNVGNRLTQTKDAGNDNTIDEVTTYLYDANDRLIDELFDGQNDGTFEKSTYCGYDKTQQTSKSASENGVITNDTTFEYNAQGRMTVVIITSYTDGVASRVEKTIYRYGSDGIRVSALHSIDSNADGTYDTATLTEYLNDPSNHTGYSQVLKTTEYSINGEIRTITKEIYYTIGLDQIAQSVTNFVDGIAQETEHYYFTYDGHGSTRVLLDTTAAIMQLYSYDAYGNPIGFNPAEALTEYLYNGEQFDSKIGQQYLRARYYDFTAGRFNRLDPFFGNLNDPQSFHKYLYAHADPVNRIDPGGKMSTSVMCSTAIGAGMRSTRTSAMFAAMKTSGTLGLLTTGANIGIIAAMFTNIARSPIPSGIMCNIGFSASVRGVVGDTTLSLYCDFKTKKVSIFFSYGAGLAPVSYFKKQSGFRFNFSIGFVFGVSSLGDLEWLSATGSLPLVALRFRTFWKGLKRLDSEQFGYAMRALANYLSPLTRNKNRSGAIQTMQSFTSSTCGFFYALKSYSFQAAITNTILVPDINKLGLIDSVKNTIINAMSLMPKSLEDMNNQDAAKRFHETLSALEDEGHLS